MGSGKISAGDVRVRSNEDSCNVSIFCVDPVGINVGLLHASLKKEELDEWGVFSCDEDVVSELVAWAYNLGYEKGKEE